MTLVRDLLQKMDDEIGAGVASYNWDWDEAQYILQRNGEPMAWFSNLAVEETPGIRALVYSAYDNLPPHKQETST